MNKAEEALHDVAKTVVPFVEGAALLVIVVGALVAFGRLAYVVARDRDTSSFVAVRLDFARFLTMGLEFQLASDLIKTAITPTFEQLGRLAALAALRTALNFFLEREMRAEDQELRDGGR